MINIFPQLPKCVISYRLAIAWPALEVAASSVQRRPGVTQCLAAVTRIRAISSFVFVLHQMSPPLIRNKIFSINKELTNCVLFQSRWWSIWYGSKERTVSRISCVYEVWPLWCESKLRNTIRQNPSHVPTPDPASHCLVSTHQYFCKVVAVIFIVIARWLDPTYPSSSCRRRQKVQCDQWKEPSFQCLHKVTTKYFQPLAITRTHSTWNILTSKHLLQSFQGEDYTLHKPEAIDIADGFCQNTVSGTSRGLTCS